MKKGSAETGFIAGVEKLVTTGSKWIFYEGIHRALFRSRRERRTAMADPVDLDQFRRNVERTLEVTPEQFADDGKPFTGTPADELRRSKAVAEQMKLDIEDLLNGLVTVTRDGHVLPKDDDIDDIFTALQDPDQRRRVLEQLREDRTSRRRRRDIPRVDAEPVESDEEESTVTFFGRPLRSRRSDAKLDPGKKTNVRRGFYPFGFGRPETDEPYVEPTDGDDK